MWEFKKCIRKKNECGERVDREFWMGEQKGGEWIVMHVKFIIMSHFILIKGSEGF